MAGIDLRAEALKFISHVRQTQSPAYFVPQAQNLAAPAPGQDMTAAQRLIFTNHVRDRFPPEDDPHNQKIFQELLETMYAVDDEVMPKPEAYAKVCILLIGHADLFYRFERFLNHGEVGRWRVQVRQKLMRELDVLTERCRTTVQTIRAAPENLTPDHLDCIERLFLSEIDNRVERDRLVAALQLDSDRYRRYVKPSLEAKLKVLGELLEFFSDFFNGVRDLSLAGL